MTDDVSIALVPTFLFHTCTSLSTSFLCPHLSSHLYFGDYIALSSTLLVTHDHRCLHCSFYIYIVPSAAYIASHTCIPHMYIGDAPSAPRQERRPRRCPWRPPTGAERTEMPLAPLDRGGNKKLDQPTKIHCSGDRDETYIQVCTAYETYIQ